MTYKNKPLSDSNQEWDHITTWDTQYVIYCVSQLLHNNIESADHDQSQSDTNYTANVEIVRLVDLYIEHLFFTLL